MHSLFLLTGAYGVGKSTLCSKSSVRHIKASTLIFNYLNKRPPQSKAVKGSANLDENQYALIQALKHMDISSSTLLEGHTCLLDEAGNVHQIPMQVFRDIGISGIIVVSRNILSVKETLAMRDGIVHTMSSLVQLQKQELQYTEQIARHLQLPRLHLDLDSLSLNTAREKIKDFVT